jgi:hypothetical protein
VQYKERNTKSKRPETKDVGPQTSMGKYPGHPSPCCKYITPMHECLCITHIQQWKICAAQSSTSILCAVGIAYRMAGDRLVAGDLLCPE